ncbi:MAG: hypothetical protein ACI9OI_000812 [Chitinophagales bacterium]|jgi:hypothetical protein
METEAARFYCMATGVFILCFYKIAKFYLTLLCLNLLAQPF